MRQTNPTDRLVTLLTLILFIVSCVITPNAAFALEFRMPTVIPGESQEIKIVGSTVIVKGLTDQINKVHVNGREVYVDAEGNFNQEIIIPLGQTEIVVTATDPEGQKSEYRRNMVAKANHFFMAGIADGTLNFSDASDDAVMTRDSNTFDDGFDADGKISYYATGKLNGQFLFKSAIDTDKDPDEGDLFTHIDPDEFFPIYGDNSTVVYDVNSQGKFYALFEWDKSGGVFGNYQTQIGDDEAKLISYNRTLFGGKLHFETPKRTIYGEPVHKSSLFFAEANQHRGHSEMLATGGSLYYLRHRNLAAGGEQIRIEVRDRNSGRVIHKIPLAHNVDYEMKYDEGRVTFKQPIMTIATSDTFISNSVLEGNPVYIVANYEYDDQDAFPILPQDLDDQTGGVRISQHFGDHVRGGFTFVQEQQDTKDLKQIGGDFTVRLGNYTKINGELAHTRSDTTEAYVSYNGGYDYTELATADLSDGTAIRIEANSAIGEYFGKGREWLDISGYWQRIDHDFAATDSLFEAGTEKFGVDAVHRMSEKSKVRAVYERGAIEKNADNAVVENQLQAKRTTHLTIQHEYKHEKLTFHSEYVYQRQADPLGQTGKDNEDHLIGERIQYDVNDYTSVYVGQQIGVTDLNESYTTVGGSMKVTKDVTAHARVGAGPKGNSVMAGLEQQTDNHHSRFMNWTYANDTTDGKSSIMSFGLNSRLGKNIHLRRERQFVTSDLRGHYAAESIGIDHAVTPRLTYDVSIQRRDDRNDPIRVDGGSSARDAYTANVKYVTPDKIKAATRAEYRINTDHLWQVLVDTTAEWKVTDDVFLYGEHEFSQADNSLSKIDKKQVAIAYRPVKFDWFNLLFKYIRFTDDRPQSQFSADGGFFEIQSKSDLFALEFAWDLPLNFQYVQKLAYLEKEILAGNPTGTILTPDDIKALLMIHRLNYHLANKIDVAAEWRRLRRKGATIEDREAGILVEVTYQIIKNIAVGLGFNFTDFKEDLIDNDRRSARGFFLRLQGKV